MLRVPKKEFGSCILHFNPCPCKTILILCLVRELNSSIHSGFGQQNYFYPVRMRPVLFQNGGRRVSGRISLKLFYFFKKRSLPYSKTRTTAERLDRWLILLSE